ncbi:hypothetical protein EDD17DRAFT_786284 [Pisolithus thermaeus]|nr:hypothetical protein EDD17DRAFT_786284 [Pisolithus thermaeus]
MRLGESAIPRYQIYSPSYGCCVEKRPNPDEHSVVAFGDSCIQLWSLSTVSLIATTLTVQTSAKWSTERQGCSSGVSHSLTVHAIGAVDLTQSSRVNPLSPAQFSSVRSVRLEWWHVTKTSGWERLDKRRELQISDEPQCSFLRWRFLWLRSRAHCLPGFAMDAMSCHGLRSGLCLACEPIRSSLSVRIADATPMVLRASFWALPRGIPFMDGTGNIWTRIVGAPE